MTTECLTAEYLSTITWPKIFEERTKESIDSNPQGRFVTRSGNPFEEEPILALFNGPFIHYPRIRFVITYYVYYTH